MGRENSRRENKDVTYRELNVLTPEQQALMADIQNLFITVLSPGTMVAGGRS